jgi:hypothetical protein
MSVAEGEYDCERRTTCLCRAPASKSSRSFRIHERAVPPESRGLGEYMRQLQQGAEIRPCIEFKNMGNHWQGEEGGELGDAH